MPSQPRNAGVRLRATTAKQRRDLASAIHELTGSHLALHAAAAAIHAGLHAGMLDAVGVYELLTSVFDRQAHAAASINAAALAMGVEL